MDKENTISEKQRLRLKYFVEGFVAALSTQEILDKARFDELENMLTLFYHMHSDKSVEIETIRTVCEKAYQDRRNHIKFYIDTNLHDDNEEIQFMQRRLLIERKG